MQCQRKRRQKLKKIKKEAKRRIEGLKKIFLVSFEKKSFLITKLANNKW